MVKFSPNALNWYQIGNRLYNVLQSSSMFVSVVQSPVFSGEVFKNAPRLLQLC